MWKSWFPDGDSRGRSGEHTPHMYTGILDELGYILGWRALERSPNDSSALPRATESVEHKAAMRPKDRP